jgi:ABC-2 type transport system permease protein
VNRFRALLAWELSSGLRRPSTWIYFGLFLGISFTLMLAVGGAWESGPDMGRSLVNSPSALAGIIPTFVLLGMTITAAIAGRALYSDYEAGIDPLLYTTPIRKDEFLGARFTGAILLNLLVFSSVGIGLALAASSPWVKADRIAAFDLASYVSPYLAFVVPNILLTASIFFALVAMTRQMLPAYVGGIALLISYFIGGLLLGNIDNKRLAALVDPFGVRAQSLVTQYWSVSEKNSLQIPLEGIVLTNRLIWLAVAIVIFAIGYRRFRFAHAAESDRVIPPPAESPARPLEVPVVTKRFDARAQVTQFWAVMRASFLRLVTNRWFAMLLAVGLFFLGIASMEAGKLFGTPTWPVTYHMEEILVGTIGTFMIVLTAIYSGELVWADRDSRQHQIMDASPVSTAIIFLGRLAALCAIIALILLVMMFAGIVTQTLKGYYNYQVGLYLQALYGIRYPDMVLFAAFAMLVHTLVNNKYVGHVMVIVLLVGMGFLSFLGLDRGFYQYSYDPGATYSDMNEWGPFLTPFVWWKAYWLSFCVLLLVATVLFWPRGEESSYRLRLRQARDRFGRPARVIAASAALLTAGLGGFIYYNTDTLNVHRSSNEDRRLRAEREKRYKKYETLPQPRVVSARVRVDLEPRVPAIAVSGTYVLRNKTQRAIDRVHLTIPEHMSIRQLTFDGAGEHAVSDSVRDYHIYRLARPMAPGDTTVMQFRLEKRKRGFGSSIDDLFLIENGTFVHSLMIMPVIGYHAGLELEDDDARRKEGLKPQERMRPPTDTVALRNNYIGIDSDWIDFEATISTDEDQTALAPGYLQREWVEGGRRLFHYTMDTPILNFWAAVSARYAVRRDRWSPTGKATGEPVEISVFHHPEHTYNVDRMITSVKRSLDYYTSQFGPYQHRQIRIVEFPRYLAFAQSLPNLIPYSEAIGFIARVRNSDDIDYPFTVTAHEVAHAWWAHQVVGANAQGATMLSETLAEYSSLMVAEKEYGAVNMRRSLQYEMDAYLIGRATEHKRESPLLYVENQPYIHYQKGALAMYALRDYIGEERVNLALRRFLEAQRFKGPPYPTSLQLVAELRAVTPDSLRYLITDLFETITLYELRTDSAVVTDAPGQPGKFTVDLWVHARKQRADTAGRTTDIAMHDGKRDWMDVGVFVEMKGDSAKRYDKIGMPLYLAKHPVDSGSQRFSVVVDRKPTRAGIDPLHKLVDRLPSNNTVKVKDKTVH